MELAGRWSARRGKGSTAEQENSAQLADSLVMGRRGRYSGVETCPEGAPMSIPMVLLPVFVLIGLTFALLFAMATVRTRSLKAGEARIRDIALGQPNWPVRAT